MFDLDCIIQTTYRPRQHDKRAARWTESGCVRVRYGRRGADSGRQEARVRAASCSCVPSVCSVHWTGTTSGSSHPFQKAVSIESPKMKKKRGREGLNSSVRQAWVSEALGRLVRALDRLVGA